MPIKRVQFPDGSIHQVEVPEGATNEQVIAFVQSQAAPASATPKQPRLKGYDDLMAGNRAAPEQGYSQSDLRVAGFGKGMLDLGLGAVQAVADGGPMGALAQKFGGMPENPVARWARETAGANAQADAELSETQGGTVGNIAFGVGSMMAPGTNIQRAGGVTNMAGRAALESGVFAGLQPVQEGDSRAVNAATGASLGYLGGKLTDKVAKIGRPLAEKAGGEIAALVEKARAAGLNLGIPDLSQNSMVRIAADQMRKLPFSGARAVEEGNRKAFNKAVAKTFGEDADAVTPSVYARAKARIGAEFDRLSERANLPASPKLIESLRKVKVDADRLAVGDTGRVVANWIEDLVSKADANGTIPGRAYQSFDSQIGKAMKSGGEAAHYLGQVRDIVRNAMDDAAPAVDKAARQAARRQYAALKTVRDLVAKDTGEGLSPQALMGRVTANNALKERSASGVGGELNDLAQIGQRFLRAAPNSGTADRGLINAGVAAALGGAANQGYIEPETAAKIGALLLGNRVALKAARSKPVTGYIAKGLPAPVRATARGGSKPLPYAAAAAGTPSIAGWLSEMFGLDQPDEVR